MIVTGETAYGGLEERDPQFTNQQYRQFGSSA